MQGVMGLLFGYLWSRYRNAWLVATLHTGVDSLVFVPVLLGW